MATLLTANLHPMGDIEIWTGNQIASSITSKMIPIPMDEYGCPTEEQPFSPPTNTLHRLALLWEHKIHEWGQILGRGRDGRPYFLDDRELHWANPTMKTPLPIPLTSALTYLRSLLSSTDIEPWAKLKRKIKISFLWNLPIAPRWRRIQEDG